MTAFCSSVASSIIFKCDSHYRGNKADFVHTRCLVLQKNLNKKPKTKQKKMAQNEIIKQNEMKQSGKQRNNKTTKQRKLPKK